ncbi:hypothetical protein IPJ63_03400 [Candidatus Nomurabacteria bacterium]|nr:MAG: hypothetical protein IPJ63_03400 [Candidatus Nomurabacteria bacterium]
MPQKPAVKKTKKVTAKRLDETLWEYCKEEAITKMGKFSARAMQYAVSLYKKRGGRYEGKKSKDNSLVKWTKEDWGYVAEPKRSRYLPKKAREHMTVGEKIATDRAKNAGTKAGSQWVKQPKKIAKKTAKYRIK